MLQGRTATRVKETLDEHIVHVETRLEELIRLRDELKQLRKQCRRAQTALTCGILDGLRRPRA